MKILIIGNKGFIGQHASRYFSKQHHVYGADVNQDYNAKNYFVIDQSNADFKSVFAKVVFDVCINCSGAANVSESIKNVARDYELNTHNVFHILNAIHQYQPQCKFINLSSAAVYGNPKVLPISENQPARPVSPYGFHKYMAETICKEFHEQFGLQTVSLRIFSAYGEGLMKQFFWDLYKKQQVSQEIELWGTGNESRDFIYIQDLLQAIDKVMNNSLFIGETINVANEKEVKIQDAAKLFIQLFNPKVEMKFNREIRKGDPINWRADITQLRALGYKQQYSIEQGLKNYSLWLKELS